MSGWIRTLFDIEAQGLRRSGTFGRQPDHALRISQLAWQTAVPSGPIDYSSYTDIIPQSSLQRHGVTLESTGLAAGKSYSQMNLPEGFLDEMSKPRGGPAGFWDKGIKETSSPIHDIFRRHVEKTIRQPAIGPSQLQTEEGVVQRLLGDLLEGPVDPRSGKRHSQFGLRGGAKRELAAWNLTYDLGRIQNVARKGGMWHQVEELLKYRDRGTLRLTDSRTKWSEFVFDMMRTDSSYTPRYTATSRINALRAKLAPGAVPTTEQLMGLTTTHDALRSFMDDWIMAGKQGHGGVWKERLGGQIDSPVGQQVAEILEQSSRGGSFHDYEKATLQIRRLGERHPEAVRMIDNIWKSQQSHMSILGKATKGREVEGVFDTAFNYVLGGKQSQVMDMLSGVKNEHGNAMFPDLVKMRHQEMYKAHEALTDVYTEGALIDLFDDLNRADADPGKVKAVRTAMKESDFIAAGVLENLRNKGIGTGVPEGPVPTAGTGGKVLKGVGKYAEDLMGSSWRSTLAAIGFGVGAAYLFADYNRELEGVRQPTSIWQEVEGITPSGTTRTDFGSGRNPLSQLLGTPYTDQVRWIPAGQLGLRGDQLYQAIIEDTQETETLRKGAWVGRAVAAALGGQISGAEHYVSDPSLGVHGYIDILLSSGIPMEIKTVASGGVLKGLHSPKPAAVSQANFYAYAMGAPYSYVAYFARDDPSQYRLFRVGMDRERVILDRQVVNDAYEVATQRGLYQPKAKGRMRILNWDGGSGLEKVWSSFKSNVVGLERYGPSPALYPRASNAFDAAAPIGDYGRFKRTKFRTTGHGGAVQQMHYSSGGSKIRDQRTRLQRAQPLVAQTPRGARHPNCAGRCETK